MHERNHDPAKVTFEGGPLRSFLVPYEWKLVDEPPNGLGKIHRYAPLSDPNGVELTAFEARRGIDYKSMSLYLSMLDKNSAVERIRVLMPREIRELESVMGSTTQGDNQYTNRVKHPDPRSPVFRLSSAQLIKVNGRTLLEVQGKFVNNDDEPTNYFRGVYIPGATHDSRITKVFLQSPSLQEFHNSERVYKQALNSIEWL